MVPADEGLRLPGARGRLSRLFCDLSALEAPTAEHRQAFRNRPFDNPYPGPYDEAGPQAEMALPGTVKFYDPARGFGFVVPDDGGRELFDHADVMLRSGLADLMQGQRVPVRAESVPRGLQATDIEPV